MHYVTVVGKYIFTKLHSLLMLAFVLCSLIVNICCLNVARCQNVLEKWFGFLKKSEGVTEEEPGYNITSGQCPSVFVSRF